MRLRIFNSKFTKKLKSAIIIKMIIMINWYGGNCILKGKIIRICKHIMHINSSNMYMNIELMRINLHVKRCQLQHCCI